MRKKSVIVFLLITLISIISITEVLDDSGETKSGSITASVSLNCSFDYTKPVIEFKIPQSVLDMAEFVEI